VLSEASTKSPLLLVTFCFVEVALLRCASVGLSMNMLPCPDATKEGLLMLVDL
jgi:hypothetical protein